MITYDHEPKVSPRNIDLVKFSYDENHNNIVPYYISDNIIVLDNVLSSSECTQFINFIDATPARINSLRKQIAGNSTIFSNLIRKRCYKFIPMDVECNCDSSVVSNWYFTHINTCWRFVRCLAGSDLPKHSDPRYVRGVDNVSIYTIMIYLTCNNDGCLIFDNGLSFNPIPGRMVVFDNRLLHMARPNLSDKYFIRSELMYTRCKNIETATDKLAFTLYNLATSLNTTNPEKASNLEKEAFSLSSVLQSLCLGSGTVIIDK